MKGSYFQKLFIGVAISIFFFATANAQNKSKGFGTPDSIKKVTDILENNDAYNSLKDLIENQHVIIVYADNSFKGNANLQRGDFVVSFNSALESIKDAIQKAGIDTSLVNTYDRNKAYITSVTQVKDLQPSSIYYVAVQSLLEEWGINAPFTKAALLNANSLFYEDELSDILRVTLGFEYGNGQAKKVAIKRYRFAILLDEAIVYKKKQIEMLAEQKKMNNNAEKARVDSIIKKIEQDRRDSISKEIEQRKADAEKKEQEARKKLDANQKQ